MVNGTLISFEGPEGAGTLHQENYFLKAMYGSNEFLDQPIQVSLDRGYLVIVYSKDRG